MVENSKAFSECVACVLRYTRDILHVQDLNQTVKEEDLVSKQGLLDLCVLKTDLL